MFKKKKPWIRFYVSPCEKDIPKVKERSLLEFLSFCSRKYGARSAFVQVMPNGMKASLSYQEVADLSDEFALYLREVLKLKTGDRVGVQLPNCLAYPVVTLGIWKAGCVLVNISPLSTSYEMAEKFDDAEMKGLFLLDMFADRLTAMKRLSVKHVCLVGITSYFRFPKKQIIRFVLKVIKRAIPVYRGDFFRYEDVPKAVLPWRAKKKVLLSAYQEKIDQDKVAALQYTGGTSGVNKAAMLTHGNLMSNVVQINQYVKSNLIEGKEVILTALPLYHIFAFTVNFLLFFYNGAVNVLVPSPRPLKNLRRAMEDHSITWITGVNTLYRGLLDCGWFSRKHMLSLKAAVAGGMALQVSVAERWKRLLGKQIVEGYGLSESSPVVTFNPIGGQVKLGTIGIPVPSTDVKCVDDKGHAVGVGEVGELLVKGPQVMRGYWRQEKETKEALKGGWLWTGDIVQMDEEGYIKVVDRKKDMILVSGFNVYPSEVEDCIAKMKEVLEVGVIGVEDDRSGEVVKACVVLKESFKGKVTDEIIKAHCKKYLSGYKVPKHVVFMKELPKTVVGKVLRRALKDP